MMPSIVPFMVMFIRFPAGQLGQDSALSPKIISIIFTITPCTSDDRLSMQNRETPKFKDSGLVASDRVHLTIEYGAGLT